MDSNTKKGIILGLILIFGVIFIFPLFNSPPEIYGLFFLVLILMYSLYSGLRKRNKEAPKL